MNSMIYYSFNIAILMLVIFAIGMFRPKWILFWMDKPGRIPIAFISATLFMVAAVMFGEGNKQLANEKPKQSIQKPGDEVPDLH
ncbi:MAG: hypothetical protein ACU836_17225 [Gammaproteobacteria bacterium]